VRGGRGGWKKKGAEPIARSIVRDCDQRAHRFTPHDAVEDGRAGQSEPKHAAEGVGGERICTDLWRRPCAVSQLIDLSAGARDSIFDAPSWRGDIEAAKAAEIASEAPSEVHIARSDRCKHGGAVPSAVLRGALLRRRTTATAGTSTLTSGDDDAGPWTAAVAAPAPRSHGSVATFLPRQLRQDREGERLTPVVVVAIIGLAVVLAGVGALLGYDAGYEAAMAARGGAGRQDPAAVDAAPPPAVDPHALTPLPLPHPSLPGDEAVITLSRPRRHRRAEAGAEVETGTASSAAAFVLDALDTTQDADDGEDYAEVPPGGGRQPALEAGVCAAARDDEAADVASHHATDAQFDGRRLALELAAARLRARGYRVDAEKK